jgi:hypothetical protein
MTRTRLVAGVLAAASAVAVAISSCGASAAPHAGAARRTLSRNGVTVTVTFAPAPDAGPAPGAGPATGQLIATFRPERAGFHLYSKDLPTAGIAGVGYPTRARPTTALAATGPAEASVDPIPLEVQAIGVTLPVYPDGPVTLTQPVRRVSRAAGTSTVLVSYAACSNTLCLPPVVDQPIAVALAHV